MFDTWIPGTENGIYQLRANLFGTKWSGKFVSFDPLDQTVFPGRITRRGNKVLVEVPLASVPRPRGRFEWSARTEFGFHLPAGSYTYSAGGDEAPNAGRRQLYVP